MALQSSKKRNRNCTCNCVCGAPPRFTYAEPFWNGESIANAISALRASRVKVDHGSLRADKSKESRIILEKALGRKVSPYAIYQASIQLKIPWESALRSAGVRDTSSFKFKKFWTRDLIIRLVKRLHSEKIPINNASIRFRMPSRGIEILKKESGFAITGTALFRAGQVYFGCWGSCIRAAGLSPNTIRTKPISKKRSALPFFSLHTERIETEDGIKTVNFLAESPQTPEEVCIRAGKVAEFHSSLEALAEGDKNLIFRAMDLLDRSENHNRDLVDLLVDEDIWSEEERIRIHKTLLILRSTLESH